MHTTAIKFQVFITIIKSGKAKEPSWWSLLTGLEGVILLPGRLFMNQKSIPAILAKMRILLQCEYLL